MKTSTIYFYAVGLNEQNLAFNKTAFENILAAGKFIDSESNERSITLNQPVAFGTSFQISAANYSIFKSATYIKIVNVDTNTETRFGFINNFLELANGNFSVSYTLDDYTNFILYASEMGVSPHIDGFTERANVPLMRTNSIIGIPFRSFTTNLPLTGKRESDTGITHITHLQGTPVFQGTPLPEGYFCAVYFINTPKYDGNPSDMVAHGTVADFDTVNGVTRFIRRDTSNIFYMVYNDQGYNVAIYDENDNVLLQMGVYKFTQVDDSTIEKIMFFDFIPTNDTGAGFKYGSGILTGIHLEESRDYYLKHNLADIIHVDDHILDPTIYNPISDYEGYYKALKITNWTPLQKFILSDTTSVIGTNSSVIKYTTYNSYMNHSLYQYIDEARLLKVKYLTAEMVLPVSLFNHLYTEFYVTFSGDGETIILKYFLSYDYPTLTKIKSNNKGATGQNTDYLDLVQVRDFKAYKNAKITGAAGIAATAIGSVVSLGTSIASGNVAGMVGALAGGGQGILSSVQKLQGLTPAQQSPANGDKSLTDILADEYKFTIEETTENTTLSALIRQLEENGALVTMSFDEYIDTCQMQAYNAIKMQYMEITGIPQQAARRISDAFMGGVTLWTATDVGNKKVINYPIGV